MCACSCTQPVHMNLFMPRGFMPQTGHGSSLHCAQCVVAHVCRADVLVRLVRRVCSNVSSVLGGALPTHCLSLQQARLPWRCSHMRQQQPARLRSCLCSNAPTISYTARVHRRNHACLSDRWPMYQSAIHYGLSRCESSTRLCRWGMLPTLLMWLYCLYLVARQKLQLR